MTVSTLVGEFRDGLASGKLLLQVCESCSQANMYPRYACPHCQSESLGWKTAGGGGRLVSWMVLRYGAPEGFEADLPYALGVVRLDEEVQLLVRLVPDADGEWFSYGCDDRVTFSPGHAAANGRACAVFGHAEHTP